MAVVHVIIISLVVLWVQISSGLDTTLTYKVPAGSRECFFEDISAEGEIDLEYQVVQGGELDIDFEILDPYGRILAIDHRRMENLHVIEKLSADGTYQFCMDNSFSLFSDKMVYLDVLIYDPQETTAAATTEENDAMVVELDIKLSDMMDSLGAIQKHLAKAINTQQYFKAREARHRHTAESNNSRVQWWSLSYCIVLVTVGVIQVYVLRRLFREKRKDKIRT